MNIFFFRSQSLSIQSTKKKKLWIACSTKEIWDIECKKKNKKKFSNEKWITRIRIICRRWSCFKGYLQRTMCIFSPLNVKSSEKIVMLFDLFFFHFTRDARGYCVDTWISCSSFIDVVRSLHWTSSENVQEFNAFLDACEISIRQYSRWNCYC